MSRLRMCVYSFFTHPLRGLLLRDNFFAKVNHSFPRPLAAQHGKYNAGQREVPAYFRYQSATLRIPPATLLEGVLTTIEAYQPPNLREIEVDAEYQNYWDKCKARKKERERERFRARLSKLIGWLKRLLLPPVSNNNWGRPHSELLNKELLERKRERERDLELGSLS
ncbi:jg18875 [Pararge aegeria aegeria]|uniref:Jg18875 protein n=1 Tax=Pararge aegeria aegeria TaxID=348720 RepID=A0A8S4RVA4_9NEOP|nr:jg18875 [Pararge aegeria aegeria]